MVTFEMARLLFLLTLVGIAIAFLVHVLAETRQRQVFDKIDALGAALLASSRLALETIRERPPALARSVTSVAWAHESLEFPFSFQTVLGEVPAGAPFVVDKGSFIYFRVFGKAVDDLPQEDGAVWVFSINNSGLWPMSCDKRVRLVFKDEAALRAFFLRQETAQETG